MEKINHQSTSIMEACGIDKIYFENKLKDWANEVNTKQYSKSMIVESLETTFNSRELSLLVHKSIEELTALQQYLPKQ